MSPQRETTPALQPDQSLFSGQESAESEGGLSMAPPAFQLKASSAAVIQRRDVNPTPIARHNRDHIFGAGGAPGMTLSAFEAYTRQQADWFEESTLTSPDRLFLWDYLEKAANVRGTLNGAGDLLLSDIQALSAVDRGSLEAFCRATGGGTVRVFGASAIPLAQRLQMGATLEQLEAVIPGSVLEVTVSQSQLSALVADASLLTKIRDYWTTYDPHLQQTFTPAAGAQGPEFQNVINFVQGVNLATYSSLLGKVRNLHRFSIPMLNQLVTNWGDTSRSKPVHLVLHTGHDAGAFQGSASLFEDLILHSPNLVLFLEGQDSLASITAQIPTIAASHGQPDGSGGFKLEQVMIAGHGQTRSVELAGTGAPGVHDGHVSYPSESMDLDRNQAQTQALLDAIFNNMDPANARLVFAGCLVGSNPVPEGTAAADIPAFIAANPSLGTFAQDRATAAGMGPNTVSAARASVALGAASSLQDGSGNMALQYGFDPDAFGSAASYVPTGREPEGVLVAAVEVAATQTPVAAATMLRTRLSSGGTSGWWNECTVAFVNLALQGVAPGAGIDIGRVNTLAHMTQIPFLTAWPSSYGVSVAHWVGLVNSHPAIANDVYAQISATPTFSAPSNDNTRQGRFIYEQAWQANGASREAPLVAYLDTTPALTAEILGRYLDTRAMAGASSTLFGSGIALSSGRIRLALAWLRNDPSNADVRSFLDAEVSNGASGPELSAAVRAELGVISEREVLSALGRLVATSTVTTSGGATVSLPDANFNLSGSGTDNDDRIEPHPYTAMVTSDTSIFAHPSFAGRALAGPLGIGSALQVAGFYDPVWAAVDHNGTMGFVLRSDITSY